MAIRIDNITKSYGATEVLANVSFEVVKHQIVSLVGPSACGKSTLLNIASGLDEQDSGTVTMTPGTKVGYMMQEPLLFPWRTLGGVQVSVGGERRLKSFYATCSIAAG